MRSQRNLIASALGLAFVLLAPPAWAQSSTSGAAQGVVTDKGTGEALPGVTVVATSPALQGTQTGLTDGSGYFKITSLPPGTYVITFYYSDITVRRSNIEVSANKVTPVYTKIDTSQAGGEVIEIKDRAPMIDPTSTNQGITLDSDYTKNIPVPGRTFESTLGAAAGSQGDQYGVSFSGSSSLENQYVVDGVNTTGLTFGTVGSPLITDFIEEIEVITGGYQAEYGRATGGVVNVVTKQGSNEFHGEVFSYFSNSLLAVDAERTRTQGSSIDFDSNLDYDLNFGFTLGGPIVKDKVWFFVGFAPRLQQLDIAKTTKRRADCRETLPDGTQSVPVDRPCTAAEAMMYGDGTPDEDPETGFFVFEDLDTIHKKQQNNEFQFVSKINYALAPEHQGQVTFSGTPINGSRRGVLGDPRAVDFDFQSITTDLSAKWTSKFNNNKTEVEGVVGWHYSNIEVSPLDPSVSDVPRQVLVYGDLGTWSMLGFETQRTAQGCRDSSDPNTDIYPFIDNCPDAGFGYSVGGPGPLTDDSEDRRTGRLSVTQRVNAAGNHEMKAGIDAEDNFVNHPRRFSGGVYYTNWIGNEFSGGPINQVDATRYVQLAPPETGESRFDDICGQTDAGPGETPEDRPCDFTPPGAVESSTFNWSAYAQDSWQILPNLTFNAGLRYEEQRLRFADHLRGTIDPLTDQEFGKNAMVLNNLWAPRLGILYDWTKEGRSKVYGSWGRFYESIPMQINDRSFGGETTYRQTFDSASQCGAIVPGYGAPDANNCEGPVTDDNLFGSGVLVAPGVGSQFLDEWILGAEYEVLEDLRIGASYKNRRLGRILEDLSTDNADTYIIANPGSWSKSEENKLLDKIEEAEMSGDTAEANRLRRNLEQFRGIRTFDKPRRDYHALELTAIQRISRDLFVQGSYTYQRTEGNFPGLFSPDTGQLDPNITSQFDLIELLANRDGPLPQDRRHYFKVDGYKIWDFQEAGQLTTGTRIRALSGTPLGAFGRHYLYGTDEAYLLPRGSMGRTPWAYDADIKLGYARKLAKGMTLGIFADLFSILSLTSQTAAGRDQTYTFLPANPVVGGSYEDLIHLKQVSQMGNETAAPVSRNLNFLNTTSRYSPFAARIGARLTF